MPHIGKPKLPTTTSLVLTALQKPGADFYSAHSLCNVTGRNYNQVSAALFHLRKHRAVDVVIEVDGSGWWFALPPETDDRTYIRDEQTPEEKKRKPRKLKVNKVVK